MMVIFEVDTEAEMVKVLRRIIPFLSHLDTHLIIFNPSWSNFIYTQLGRKTDISGLIYDCLAKKTANRTWRLFKNFVASVTLSALKFASSNMQGHAGKIVLIKTVNEALPKDALSWIKENRYNHVIDVYGCCNLSGNDLLPYDLQ